MGFESKVYKAGMTVSQLHTELGRAIDAGLGDAEVGLSADGGVGPCLRLVFSPASEQDGSKALPKDTLWIED